MRRDPGEKVDQGIGVLPRDQEKYRLYWENLPVWFKFSDHAKLLGSYGGVILTSLYVHAWSFEFDLDKDPLETLAENYVSPLLEFNDRGQGRHGD
jgi:hypothetical protein